MPIHSHIEPRSAPKTEATLTRFQLMRRDTQIQNNAIHQRPTDLRQDRPSLREIRLPHHQPIAKSAQPLAHRRQRLVIHIQPEAASPGAAVNQNLLCVSSASHGAVQISFPRFGSEEVNDLPSHYRKMNETPLVTVACPTP